MFPVRFALLAALVAVSMALVPSAAWAQSIPDSAIPDTNLRNALKTATGTAQDQEITEAAAGTLTLLYPPYDGPVHDLTGLERFSNLQHLSVLHETPSTLSDLGPLATMTNLENVSVQNARISDLTPLAGLTRLQTLNLGNNEIADLSTLPNLPNAVDVNLNTNRITDVTPLLDKQFDPDKLEALNLSRNRITDASALVPLGTGTKKLGNWTTSSNGLDLGYNRIADFSAFSVWVNRLGTTAMRDQVVYAGTYRAGGITLPLKSASTTATSLPAGSPATYDRDTNLLTLTGSEPVDLRVNPHWTVVFSGAPDAADPAAPTISGTPLPNQVLTVASEGSWKDGVECPTVAYQWFRDDVAIQAIPLADRGRPSNPNPVLGDGGSFPTYRVQPMDIGRRLSVRISCDGTPIYGRSAPTAVVTNFDPQKPVIQGLDGTTTLGTQNTLVTRSGVLGDPTNLKIPFYVSALDADDELVPPEQLTVTVDRGNSNTPGGILAADGLKIEGTGYERTLTLIPEKVGSQSAIAIRVTAPSGKSDTLYLGYQVSPPTTPTSRVLQAFADPSTAIAVGDGHLLVADDEKPAIHLYDARVSGREKGQFRIDSPSGEIDWESSARKGDTVYWFGSHGNNKSGQIQTSRHIAYASTLTDTGANAKLAPKGVGYPRLRTDLVAWDQANGDRLGFAAATQAGKHPDALDGFNIEGAEFSPDGSELYLGFRSPLVPATAAGKALIVPVKNIEELTTAPVGEDTRQAVFGEPILLDLEGQSIREIRKNAEGEYLILGANGGGTSPANTQALWVWDGERDTAPMRLGTAFTADIGPANAQGGWEAIGEMPSPLAAGGNVGVIIDQGFDFIYGGNLENKDDNNLWTRKARHDLVTVSAPVSTAFATSDPGAFPAQPANTIGTAQTVKVTNSGFTPLNRVELGQVRVVDEDGVSRDEFLISSDDCAGEVLEKGESCDVRVRYAPSRTNATSTATLEISGNLPGGKTTVALTGTSTDLPKGEDGEDGTDGQDGADGQTGGQGATGQNGAWGPGGPAGPKGDKGDRGSAGRDGTFTFRAARSSATRARRGRRVSLAFTLRNGTTARAKALTAKASTPKALKASHLRSSSLKSLAAGRSRTIRLTFRVGRTAKLGRHRVRVQLKVDGATVTRTVTVKVTRESPKRQDSRAAESTNSRVR